MEIENDYLSQIFDGDQLFVLLEDIEKSENYSQPETSVQNEVRESQEEIKVKPEQVEGPQKEVVILVSEKLGSQEKETLGKLLKAINIEESQYEIIHDHPEQLKTIQHLKLFLSFHNQYVQSSEYQILKINKGNAIYAHDLAELNKDASKKLMLWNLLKTIV